MKRFIGVLALLMLIGSISQSALAAELRASGFFENVFPHVDQNTSDQDLDMTRNDDQIFFGRERVRLFFNFIASDDLRGVFALEIDGTYGAPRSNRVGSRCGEHGGPPGARQLNRGRSDAARSTVDHDRFTCLKPSALEDVGPYREQDFRKRRGLREIES